MSLLKVKLSEDAIQFSGGFASNVPPYAKIEFSRINQDNFERKLNLFRYFF